VALAVQIPHIGRKQEKIAMIPGLLNPVNGYHLTLGILGTSAHFRHFPSDIWIDLKTKKMIACHFFYVTSALL
jgi:hypothetical protein